MKTYAIKTRFSFTGKFLVKAENEKKARERVMNDCGLVLGGGIHTSQQEGDVDWEFPIHPEKEILNIRKPHKKDNNGKRKENR